MEDKNMGQITVESIWAKLTPEEKSVFKQAQSEAVSKASARAAAQAKKKNTKRISDDKDRDRVRKCLQKVGCEARIALNDVRSIALRWVLDNHSEEFGEYVKSLREA